MLCIGESNEDKGRKDIEEKGREDERDTGIDSYWSFFSSVVTTDVFIIFLYELSETSIIFYLLLFY